MNGFGHGELVFFVRDGGAGFETAYADKPFCAGQFEGLGIGLAAVQRIVHHHDRGVWGEVERDTTV